MFNSSVFGGGVNMMHSEKKKLNLFIYVCFILPESVLSRISWHFNKLYGATEDFHESWKI